VQTQRDHVHAHQFMMSRLNSALVMGDPSGGEVPGRRALTGLLFGILVAVLVVAGFGVYGWIVPGGSKSYREPGLVLVEKETGTRYVLVNGVLHPADLPTALLWQGAAAKVKLVSRKSLAGVPRGHVIGIAGGPRDIPPPESFVSGPWLVCAPGPSGSAAAPPRMTIDLDPRAPFSPVPENEITVVRGPGGTVYLLTQGRRFRVLDDAVLVALGVAAVSAYPAPDAWLSHLPAGPDLVPVEIPRRGDAGPRIGGRPYRIGTLFRHSPGPAQQFFVLRSDGLAVMSRTEFLFAAVRSRTEPVFLESADVVAAPKSADRSLLDRLPDLADVTVHQLDGRTLCLRQAPDSATTVRSVVVEAPAVTSGNEGAGRGAVRGPVGAAMVVFGVPRTSSGAVRLYYVSSEGVAFLVKDSSAAAALKINGVKPVPFPRELLTALRKGPALSRESISVLAEG
jgi:type VII secretion protein EccB